MPEPRPINTMRITRIVNEPYEIWTRDDWEWRVLKKYQIDDNKPYARWFCAVKTPHTSPSYDMGDCYCADIIKYAVKIEFDPTKIELW